MKTFDSLPPGKDAAIRKILEDTVVYVRDIAGIDSEIRKGIRSSEVTR